MAMKNLWVLTALTSLLCAAPARAEEMSLPVELAKTIDNGDGAHRVLLRIGELYRLEGIAIASATLTFPSARAEGDLERELALQVFPITRSWDETVTWDSGWDRPGGDFDEHLYARRDVQPEEEVDETFEIDVGSILWEIQQGTDFHGFLVSVAPYHGIGIEAADLGRFAGLSQATVEVVYRGRRAAPSRDQ